MDYLKEMLVEAYENNYEVMLIYRNGKTKIETHFIPKDFFDVTDSEVILYGTGDDRYEFSIENFDIEEDREDYSIDMSKGSESVFFALIKD